MKTLLEYQLPSDLIARYPAQKRTDSRLLRVSPETNQFQHAKFTDLITFLQPNDCLFLNDTLVIPAQLNAIKKTGGKVHCQIDRIHDDTHASCFLRASKPPKIGDEIFFEDNIIAVIEDRFESRFELCFSEPLQNVLDKIGNPPIPPYFKRAAETIDRERYQTCFAKHPGAVAAPTAGLHFDQATLAALRSRGINIAKITLHVGAGTFEPLRPSQLASGRLHAERMLVDAAACELWEKCRAKGGRIIAVGTTCVRALETAYEGHSLKPFSGETDLLIQPGYDFKAVDAILTNFHLPGSSLLLLVAAFAGVDVTHQAYKIAIDEQYRFYSYGDCMLIDHLVQSNISSFANQLNSDA